MREREGVLPFGQLQIELHIWNQRFQDFLEWWELLEAAGLSPFHQEVRFASHVSRLSGFGFEALAAREADGRTDTR